MLLTIHPDPTRAAGELPLSKISVQTAAASYIALSLQHPQQPSTNDRCFRNDPLLLRWLIDHSSALYDRIDAVPHQVLHNLLGISTTSFGVDWDHNYPLSEVAEAMEQIPMRPSRHAFHLSRIAASRALCELEPLSKRLQFWDDRFYYGQET